jgi:hypothetical protein
MNTRFPKVCWFWLFLGFVTVFHLIAGVGCWRERHDVRVIQERYRSEERDMREKFGEIHEGDSLEKVRRLFPNAYYADLVDGAGEVRVYFRTGYNENSSCSNILMEIQHIQIVSGNVAGINGVGGGGKHMDRFALPTPWYYFKRAWYSSAVTGYSAWW